MLAIIMIPILQMTKRRHGQVECLEIAHVEGQELGVKCRGIGSRLLVLTRFKGTLSSVLQ